MKIESLKLLTEQISDVELFFKACEQLGIRLNKRRVITDDAVIYALAAVRNAHSAYADGKINAINYLLDNITTEMSSRWASSQLDIYSAVRRYLENNAIAFSDPVLKKFYDAMTVMVTNSDAAAEHISGQKQVLSALQTMLALAGNKHTEPMKRTVVNAVLKKLAIPVVSGEDENET